MQDETVLSNQRKVKSFLEQHEIAYDPASPAFVLRGMAKAKMKRMRDEALSPSVKRSLFEAGTTMTVLAVIAMIKRLEANCEKTERFKRVAFTFEEMSEEKIARKHGITSDDCKGSVTTAGLCRRCGAIDVNPDLEYAFKAIIAQIPEEGEPSSSKMPTLTVQCAAGAGRTMFGYEPSAFDALDAKTKSDKIEAIMCRPMSAGIIIKYDPEKDDTFLCLYDVVKMEY